MSIASTAVTTETSPAAGAPTGSHRLRRTLLDVALALAAFVATVAQLAHGGTAAPHAVQIDPLPVALAAGATLPLLLWRRHPLAVFCLSALVSVLAAGLGHPVDLLVGPAVALYLLAASRERDEPWRTRFTVVVVGLLGAYLVAVGVAEGGLPGVAVLHTGLATAGAWFAGERTRLRREQLAELRERARRAERDAVRERQLAVAEERARLARDLHDSAGHAVSVIAVRAGAARLRHDREPERSLAALTAIEELARHTAQEIDQIVATLREPGATETAPAGLASLDTLVARHEALGLTVTRRYEGRSRPLPATADQAAYRILQEALANASRHGTGSAAVTVEYAEDALGITVTNSVSGNGSRPARNGGGHGLIGMTERASALGGELRTERVEGLFRLSARIPYGGGV